MSWRRCGAQHIHKSYTCPRRLRGPASGRGRAQRSDIQNPQHGSKILQVPNLILEIFAYSCTGQAAVGVAVGVRCI